MTDEDLEKANELREQIRELSLFLLTARMVHLEVKSSN